jgi:hypothetical protein
MRPLAELLSDDNAAWTFVRAEAAKIPGRCTVLPPASNNGEVLYKTQVTTRSPMGSIVYRTGGILVDGGWLRILGSGAPELTRTLPGWNEGRSTGFCLVADDAVGGFFAIDGGGLGFKPGNVCYWEPDTLKWISLAGSFTAFLQWAFHDFGKFYDALRWPTWRKDVAELKGDQCFHFYPFLWTKEGSIGTSHKAAIPVQECFDSQMDVVRQLAGK